MPLHTKEKHTEIMNHQSEHDMLVVYMCWKCSTISVMLKDRDYDVTPHIILILSLIEVPQIRNGSAKEWEV